MISTASRQLAAGWMLTSITPGSGVTLMTFDARIVRRRIALDVHRRAGIASAVASTRRDQLEIVLEPLDRRHEHAEHAVARLDRQRGAHGAPPRRCCSGAPCGGRSARAASCVNVRQRAARLRRILRDDVGIVRPAGRSGSEPSGRRKPSGESPGTRNSLPRRSFQRSLRQRRDRAAFQRCTGSTIAARLVEARARTPAPCGRAPPDRRASESHGSTLTGSSRLLQRASAPGPRRPA